MKFVDMSLTDILRYFVAGYWGYFLWKIYKIDLFNISSTVGEIEKNIIIFIFGAVTYFVYRTIIYSSIVRFLSDILNAQNIRLYFKKNYSIEKWDEQNDLYYNLESKFPQINVDINRIWSSSIHMQFIISLISLTDLIIISVTQSTWQWPLFILFICFFISALRSEIAINKRSYRNFLLQIYWDKNIKGYIDEYKNRMQQAREQHQGYNREKEPPPRRKQQIAA